MSSVTSPITFGTPPRVRQWIVAAMIIATALWTVVKLTAPTRLNPDEIVRETGTYLSWRGERRVVISESGHGTVCVRTERLQNEGDLSGRLKSVLARRDGFPDFEFEVERDWFLCFDAYDRMWLFVGRWNPQWGSPRRLSSGGYFHSVQSVLLDGFILSGKRAFEAHRSVGDSGDWRGVPPRFFEQLPGRDEPSAWGDIPPIPATAPAFTPGELEIIAAGAR